LATFEEHITHSKENLDYLSKINQNINDRWDWQVTVCFYSALHLINAHIVKKTGVNYLSHSQVSIAINPYNPLSISKLDEATFLAYEKLFQLSRRSRYLLSENFKKGDTLDIQPACITYSKHFKKTICHLNTIVEFISKNYNVNFAKTEVICIELNGLTFENFKIKN
jgi:hypothetical protein